jgi:transcriptional regulator with XRE-family HTH domain
MNYAIEHITATLRSAREAKGLSQRALSELAGVPQSHISKIENGAVDLRVSSLVELARVLDLELALVPRKSVPAVNSIIRSTSNGKGVDRTSVASRSAANELQRLQKQLNEFRQFYSTNTELAQLQRQLRDLQHLKIPLEGLDTLREINDTLKAVSRAGKLDLDLDVLRQPLRELQDLRNSIVHSGSFPITAKVRPAYSLEEDEDGG